MTYDTQEKIEEIVNRFYHGKDTIRAREVFTKYADRINKKSARILTGLLEERQALLDSSEPFFDKDQLTSAINYSLGWESLGNRPYFEGGSGGRDPVLASVAEKIALEGFVEADSREPRELE